MPGVSARRDPPAAVRAAAGLGRWQRPLAVAVLDEGGTAVATRDHLAVVDPGAGAAASPALRWRRPWHEVDAGTWDDAGRVLQVSWVGGGRDALAVVGDTGTRLPEVLRERVQSTVVASRHVLVDGARGVRLVVRRAPRGLLLQEVADRGVDLGSPRTQAVLASERDALAAEVGLDAHAPAGGEQPGERTWR